MQTCTLTRVKKPLHVGIIMDGNGRWAAGRGIPRSAGHRAGLKALRRIVEAAPDLGIGTLTLYTFSSDNWRRPGSEVAALMILLGYYLRQEAPKLAANSIRLTAIGRRDRFDSDIQAALEQAEQQTAAGQSLHLRLALDYSSRDSIVTAANELASEAITRESLTRHIIGDATVPSLDLMVRTGGEQRLSDFMLWEAAYAELYFTKCLWPDFDADDLALALADYFSRERRFGGLPEDEPKVFASGG
jgi:undecaprenyl diphosphate synthase